MPNAQVTPAAAIRTVRILWLALLSSTLLIGVVAFVVDPGRRVVPPQTTVVGALSLAALACAVASFLLPARAHAAAIARSTAEVKEGRERERDAMHGGFLGGSHGGRRFAHPDRAMRAALVVFQTQFIVSLALSEAVALVGLALRMQGMAPVTVLPFFVAAALLIAVRFPTRARIFARFERRHGATFD
jgi:hypothetical protein